MLLGTTVAFEAQYIVCSVVGVMDRQRQRARKFCTCLRAFASMTEGATSRGTQSSHHPQHHQQQHRTTSNPSKLTCDSLNPSPQRVSRIASPFLSAFSTAQQIMALCDRESGWRVMLYHSHCWQLLQSGHLIVFHIPPSS
jgi:hypothetical protein